MDTFKIKIGGVKYKARFMGLNEKINEKTLHLWCSPNSPEYIKEQILCGQSYNFLPSQCLGELVSDHAPDKRLYIEVLSPHYKVY